MNGAIASLAETLRAVRAHGRPLLLLFDYDGTLSPIVDHPTQAVLSPTVRTQLADLSRLPGVRVGVLSGRTLGDLKERVDLPGLDYAGTGGLEWETGGRYSVHPEAPAKAPLIRSAVEALEPVVAKFPGAWIERKPLAITVHFRAVSGRDLVAFELRVRHALRALASELKMVKATAAFEILPRLFWDKGSVVRLLHAASPPRAGLLYAGDSEGDRDAMEVVTELGGWTLGVGPEAPSLCTGRLDDPSALSLLLGALLREGPS